jgi:uncharacterized BrkB/YihY/UPF0761 family membrane protein
LIAARRHATRASISRRGLVPGAAIVAIVVIGLATSLWMVVKTSSSALVLAWTAIWCFYVGVVGWHARSWSWVVLCPAAMLLLILVWVAVLRHTSWTSGFITVVGAMFAVAATVGAVVGAWLGKRCERSE